MEISKAYNLSPFEVLQQEKDNVIMTINYFIEKGDSENGATITHANTPKRTRKHDNARVRVNDKTATGGWF